MSTNRFTRPAVVLGAVALAAAAAVATAGPAVAESAPAAPAAPAIVVFDGDVIASDDTVVASADRPTATASIPRGIVVTHHGGQPVTLTAPGQPTQRKPRPGSAPATFTGLKPGVTYTVTVGNRQVARVTALDKPKAASGLVVRTTGTPDAVTLSWTHKATRATGGNAISYDVVATPASGAAVRTTVTGKTNARLAGLNPHELYRFSVTPRNTAGKGTPTSASMRRTLASITGIDATVTTPDTTTPATEDPRPTQPAPIVPEPTRPTTPSTPAAAPAPGPAPTRVIYVCPDGYTDSGSVCTKTMAYTYHSVTETKPYTYHSEFIETSRVWRDFGTDWSGTTCPNGGTMHDGHCVGWDIQGYTIQVKDNPPSGWLDDGSSYVRQVPEKDPMPAGYTDDGTQWVATTGKIAQTVPA